MARLKVYYPDGQIQKGLYTQGGEWMFEDGTEYIGDYHKYTTGEVYTRGSYVKNVSKPLVPFVSVTQTDLTEAKKYDKLNKVVSSYNFAVYGKTIPTIDDYGRGYIVRYFVKRHFNDIITEVTKDTYGTLNKEFYIKLDIRWKLNGDAVIVNQRTVNTAEKTIEGISNYITNYSEFVKV